MHIFKPSLLALSAMAVALLPGIAKAQSAADGAEEEGASDPVSTIPDDRERSTSARNKAKGFSAQVGVELRYDSNVVIDDIDLNSGLGDEAAVFTARGEYEGQLGPDTTFSAGYRFSQLAYREFSDFDLQTHSVSAGIEHDLGKVDLELDYRFTHARLGGDGFVDIHRVSPKVSARVSREVLLRGAYIYTDKDFKDREDRDAQVHGGEAQIYWLVDGAKTYFVLAARVEEESAVDPQFSFSSQELRARFVQRFKIAGKRAHLRLGARFELRDYEAETPSIAEERDEDRLRLSAEVEWRVAKKLEVSAGYEYSDFNSNLATVNYTQSMLFVAAKFRL